MKRVEEILIFLKDEVTKERYVMAHLATKG